jgi:regulator of cell morphogenesis and NO signaling
MLEPNSTIREIVADDYRAAAVFQRHGLDFCCGGNRPVADACQEAGIDAAAVMSELEQLTAPATDQPRVTSWPLDFLADFIVSNHHAYVRSAIETIGVHARKVASVHGENHPETVEIARRFEEIAAEMTSHMAKEERILFPYIRSLALAERNGEAPPPAPFGTIANPIRMMEAEHQSAGDTMAAIRRLSRGYQPPEDACTTYKVTYKELEAFEADLHRHVHLENNVLFPRALQLEQGVAS